MKSEGSPGSKKAFIDDTPMVYEEHGSRLVISRLVVLDCLMTGVVAESLLSVILTWYNRTPCTRFHVTRAVVLPVAVTTTPSGGCTTGEYKGVRECSPLYRHRCLGEFVLLTCCNGLDNTSGPRPSFIRWIHKAVVCCCWLKTSYLRTLRCDGDVMMIVDKRSTYHQLIVFGAGHTWPLQTYCRAWYCFRICQLRCRWNWRRNQAIIFNQNLTDQPINLSMN